jgi:hypothetical protein
MVSLSLVTVGRTMAAQDAGASAQANAQAKIRILVDT